jgi:hypothetical protein
MILHLAQRFLTDGLTFMVISAPFATYRSIPRTPDDKLEASQNLRLSLGYGHSVFEMS